MTKIRTYHLCVEIDGALKMLAQGKNIFNDTIANATYDLVCAQKEGKKYYSGCDNMDQSGRCQGHSTKKKKDESKKTKEN